MKALLAFFLVLIGSLVCLNACAPSFSHTTLGYFGPFRVSAAVVLAGLVALVISKGK